MKKEICNRNLAWEKVQIARNIKRPSSSYYINNICEKFVEVHGDRCYGDDEAVIAGIGKMNGISVVMIGISKGNNTEENIRRNFGMPRPEGYRKALRMMKYAESHRLPLVCFIDTPGASCGVEAEQRGQGMAIAQNLCEMSILKVPIISILIGEGGSGGAIALGIADRILMLENSIYSILSPEGFAQILWKDVLKASEAAEAMKLTSSDLKELNVIDKIIKEPEGGAHNNIEAVADLLKKEISNELNEIMKDDINVILKRRHLKFRKMGMLWNEEGLIK